MRLFKSAPVTEKAVRDILSDAGIEADLIESLIVSDKGDITLVLTVRAQSVEADERRRYELEQKLHALKNAGQVRVILTAEAEPGATKPAAPKKALANTGLSIPGVKRIVAIASAKGGVGKSTLTLNLAIALSAMGLKVGVLDADVFGPSMPTMTGTRSSKPNWKKGEKLRPVEDRGLKLMSIGYLSEVDDAMIWRGPMVMSAINQMMRDVDWGELDLLLIDTPPGTGDAQLTLAQKVALDGAVIVSTPQEVALADVRRGIAMFGKTNVPVLGLVENMAWFEDAVSGNRTYIFGEGGARSLAQTSGISFLGEVPILADIRTGGDCGRPVAGTDSPAAPYFDKIAGQLLVVLGDQKQSVAPKIVFE